MTNSKPFPVLRIVPIEQIRFHEAPETDRAARLVERLAEDRHLLNPPIVASLPQDQGYLLIDGANRISAMRLLGYQCVPVQIINYDDPALRLGSWHHAVMRMSWPAWIEQLRAQGLAVEIASAKEVEGALATRQACAALQAVEGACAFIPASDNLRADVHAITRLIDTYKKSHSFERVDQTNLADLRSLYHDLAALVLFPPFEKREVMQLVADHLKLPTGLTRHSIPGRVLRVNIQLDVLRSDLSLEDKNEWLEAFVRMRLQERHVRFYPEPVFIFDD
ncbi:MAG: ParB N-terminal domain-containing protein [candidate division KSB1 bacterium]|nr:ParB N-terminal domain-containing protein [candidate division KSB1 bacterium]MDZ7367370.1 ParB N-terminal domain-containing protein [candidate division KSB1 bacterium]MDZ7405251.1 ParB N-terminal domain-containing protein [candidate division KSB1 bacterium]